MRVISAYLLAVLGGNSSPKADDITKILSSVGIEADKERVASLLKELEGKDINAVIAEGAKKLASIPSGGGAPAAAAAPAAEEKKAPAKKVVEKEPSEEEDLGFSLFD